jgi:Fur family transcriptional regulator, ferric uptake regulator
VRNRLCKLQVSCMWSQPLPWRCVPGTRLSGKGRSANCNRVATTNDGIRHLETARLVMSTTRPQPPRRLLEQLRARGIRLTAQRTILMNILDAEDGFVDVATLCNIARRKGARVDRATVYRTLALLRAHDLLNPGVGPAVPAERPAVPPLARDELVLVCERCGAQQPAAAEAPDSIKREILKCTGFDARAARLEAVGECRLCAAKSRLRSRSKAKPAFRE